MAVPVFKRVFGQRVTGSYRRGGARPDCASLSEPQLSRGRQRYDVCMLVRNTFTVDGRVEREGAYLAECGLRVLVVAIWEEGLAEHESMLGFDVRRIRTPPYSARGQSNRYTFLDPKFRNVGLLGEILQRVLRLAATSRWYAEALARVVSARPKTVHCHDLDTLIPGSIAAQLLGSRLVYDSHELWTERYTGLSGLRRRIDFAKYTTMERLLAPWADAVITVSEGIADELRDRYGLSQRPTVLRNVPLSCEPTESKSLRDRVEVGGPLWLHLGVVDVNGGLMNTLQALVSLPEVTLVLMGPVRAYGFEPLMSHADRLGVRDRVVHLPPVPRNEIVAWAASADLGLCILQPVCLNHVLCLPNKFFEYAMAGIPIVSSDLPELRAWVQRHHLGALCDPTDPGDIARAASDILERRVPLATAEQREAFRRTYGWQQEKHRLVAAYPELGHTSS